MLVDWLQASADLLDKKTLFDGLIGALAGGIISAIITIFWESKRNRTEVALHFLEQFLDQYDDLAKVKGFLQNTATLTNPADVNKVRKSGDWFEIVAAASFAKIVDDSLLDKVGIASEIKSFHRMASAASHDVQGLPDVTVSWPNLEKYVARSNQS